MKDFIDEIQFRLGFGLSHARGSIEWALKRRMFLIRVWRDRYLAVWYLHKNSPRFSTWRWICGGSGWKSLEDDWLDLSESIREAQG